MVDENGDGVDVDRGDADGHLLGGGVDLASDIPSLIPLTEKARQQTAPFWSEPLFMPSRNHTYFVYTRPLYDGDTYRGSFMAGMSLETGLRHHLDDFNRRHHRLPDARGKRGDYRPPAAQ